jgi:threonine dehydrogenase-like Zn-dependent dehydrogenase
MLHAGASGGVGLMAIQLATAAGLQVVGTASTREGLEAIIAAGAAAAYDHSQTDYLCEVHASHPNGFDICVEMLANRNLGERGAGYFCEYIASFMLPYIFYTHTHTVLTCCYDIIYIIQ